MMFSNSCGGRWRQSREAVRVMSKAHCSLHQLLLVARGRYHRQHFPAHALSLPACAGGRSILLVSQVIALKHDVLLGPAIAERTESRLRNHPHAWPLTAIEHAASLSVRTRVTAKDGELWLKHFQESRLILKHHRLCHRHSPRATAVAWAFARSTLIRRMCSTPRWSAWNGR